MRKKVYTSPGGICFPGGTKEPGATTEPFPKTTPSKRIAPIPTFDSFSTVQACKIAPGSSEKHEKKK